MEKVKCFVDHFCCETDKEKADTLLRRLGFVYGNNKFDKLIHVMFDNCYLEYTEIKSEGVLGTEKVKIIRGKKANMGTIWLGSNDISKTYEDLRDAGYPVMKPQIGAIGGSRRAKHGTIKGSARFAGLGFSDSTPFDSKKTIFGVVQHMTPELIYPKQRYLHVNNARSVSTLIFVCKDEDRKLAAYKYFKDFEKFFSESADKDHNIPAAIMVDLNEYKKIFGVTYEGDKEMDLAAVVFEGGDKVYIKEQLDGTGIHYFENDNGLYRDSLYLDVREYFGSFFVFECDVV